MRKQEGLRFEPDESSAKHSDARVKIRGCGVFQICEETPDPWREVVVEDLTIGSCRRRNCAAGETCHDLQENRGMIFRLRLSVYPLDADPLQYLAKAREWATLERTR
ncbi:MAG: hypothetical protein WA642_01925 [Steroidobacteraceae bacterium]